MLPFFDISIHWFVTPRNPRIINNGGGGKETESILVENFNFSKDKVFSSLWLRILSFPLIGWVGKNYSWNIILWPSSWSYSLPSTVIVLPALVAYHYREAHDDDAVDDEEEAADLTPGWQWEMRPFRRLNPTNDIPLDDMWWTDQRCWSSLSRSAATDMLFVVHPRRGSVTWQLWPLLHSRSRPH